MNMTGRKQHVIKIAHQLFIEKGFRSTSIQDILEYSGISKGTLYNYFSSKSELFIALFTMIHEKMAKDRDELLIGQNPSDIEIFIKQIELQLEVKRANKLDILFEEVFFSDDIDLKQFIKLRNLIMLRWYYRRFVDLFGEDKKPYLLDCAVMFSGMLHQNMKYYAMAHGSNISIQRVVRYSVDRIVKMVDEVSKAGEQLIEPELLDRWLPEGKNMDEVFQQKLCHTVAALKKNLSCMDQSALCDLLDFIQEELLQTKIPRKFLIDSAILFLKKRQAFFDEKELQNLEEIVDGYFAHADEPMERRTSK